MLRNPLRAIASWLTIGIPLALLAACFDGGTTPASNAGGGATYPPARVFALLDPGESPSAMARFAALATVDGLAFRARWRDLEPNDGGYDWSALDAAFDAVRAHDKRLTVHVGVSGGGWPDWLRGADAVIYNYTGPQGGTSDPLPWDAVFLARYERLVATLAAHLRDRGDLARLHAVSVGAPVAEMSLVACRNNLLGGFAYNRASYLAAWAASIGSHGNRFGEAAVLVSAPVGMICAPDNDGGAFYQAVMSAAQPTTGRLAIFAADLNAQGSARVGALDAAFRQRFALHLQTIWSASDDPGRRLAGSLSDAVCQGLRLGAAYLEIYRVDLESAEPATRQAIETARTGRGCD